MKNFKNGYTLGEVLITLGIIGIIAAITVPTLVNNSSRRTDGAELGRAKELIEHATASVINTAIKNNESGSSYTTLTGIRQEDVINNSEGWLIANDENADSNWITTVQGITGLKSHPANYLDSIKMYSGDDLLSAQDSFSNIADFLTFKFDKSKYLIIYEPIGEVNLGEVEPEEILTRIFVDINGSDEPNRVGKDIFLFGLANNGHIVPAGSEAYNRGNSNTINVNSCVDDNNDVDNELACAAKVAADNWRINY